MGRYFNPGNESFAKDRKSCKTFWEFPCGWNGNTFITGGGYLFKAYGKISGNFADIKIRKTVIL